MKSYSFEKVSVLIGDQPLVGFAEGDDAIKITHKGEGVTQTVGVDGNVTYNQSMNKTVEFKFKLAANSLSNMYLTKLYKDEESISVMIKDINGGEVTESAAECRVVKIPDSGFGGKIGSREWTILGSVVDSQFKASNA